MPLTARPHRSVSRRNGRDAECGAYGCAAMGRAAGFTLIEAVVASAILLLTCAGVTGAVTASLRGQGIEEAQMRLERRAQAEIARLSALPYSLPALPPGADGYDPGAARSLLQAVFPHALAAHNAAAAFFTPASAAGPAAFTTVSDHGWGSLRVAASFVTAAEGAWVPADTAAVEGWAVWLNDAPPSSAVRITVRASSPMPQARTAEAALVLDGLRPTVSEPAP